MNYTARDKNFYIKNYLYIGTTDRKGKGVYASRPLKAGTTIEVSPVIIMSEADLKHLDETLLHDYVFEWLPGNPDKKCCMALGYVPSVQSFIHIKL